MNSDPPPPIYSIDTSALMEWHDRYYPTDVFPGLVDRFNVLVEQKRIVISGLVQEEVEAMGSNSLKSWLKSHKKIINPTTNHLAPALLILGNFPDLRDLKASYEEADPYVIALAQINSAVVLTQETEAAQKARARRKLYIPDVCRSLGIPCVNLLGLMRLEGWQL